jgi:site-specific recombinase XerD
MLEAGVPLMAIKNFLGHSSVSTTQRYAELSQGTVNRHIKDWNDRWFPVSESMPSIEKTSGNRMPDFLS